jgi:hypothetical protein
LNRIQAVHNAVAMSMERKKVMKQQRRRKERGLMEKVNLIAGGGVLIIGWQK